MFRTGISETDQRIPTPSPTSADKLAHASNSLVAAMPPKAVVVEEEMVGRELHVTKPMKFKVSVT